MNNQIENENENEAAMDKFLWRVTDQVVDSRKSIEHHIDTLTTRLDFLTRPEFGTSAQSAMAGIAEMVKHKPVMSKLLRERVSLYHERVVHNDEDDAQSPILELEFHVMTWSKEDQKPIYYEIMSFCKDDDAPFCDPNCSVKVAYGTTIMLPLSLDMHDYNFVVKFFAEVPDTVLAYLGRKNMVQSSPGYASPGSLSIVCPTEN